MAEHATETQKMPAGAPYLAGDLLERRVCASDDLVAPDCAPSTVGDVVLPGVDIGENVTSRRVAP